MHLSLVASGRGFRDVYLKYERFFEKYTFISTIVFNKILLYTIKIGRNDKETRERLMKMTERYYNHGIVRKVEISSIFRER